MVWRPICLVAAVAGCKFTGRPNPGDLDAVPVIDAPPVADGPDAGTPDGAPDAFVPFVRRINIGGPEHVGVDFPGTWDADPGGTCGPTIWTVAGEISGTVDDALFVNHAYGLPTMTCAIAGLPVATYEVTMLFGPTYYGTGGTCNTTVDQIFSIALEGVVVVPSFNLTAASAGCVLNGTTGQPVAQTFTALISDGTLDIVEVSTTGGAAMVSAIQLVSQP